MLAAIALRGKPMTRAYTEHTLPREPHVIRLYQFAPAFGLPNASPFCMKVETLLRMSGLPFELDNRGLIQKAPKGKLPFIRDGEATIADSEMIARHLRTRHGVDLDAHLGPADRAAALAFERLCAEHLYWAAIQTRWIDEAGFRRTKAAFFGAMPWPLRQLVPVLARRNIRAQLRGHGMGRHSPDEIMALGCADIDAIAAWLGDKPFFMGETPSRIDATIHAFVANVIRVPLDSPLKSHALQHAQLDAYCDRMQARFYAS